jgi:hypothetical protein
MKQTKISRIRALTLTIMVVGKMSRIHYFFQKTFLARSIEKNHDRKKCVGPTILFFVDTFYIAKRV